jgi:hypothetical protein
LEKLKSLFQLLIFCLALLQVERPLCFSVVMMLTGQQTVRCLELEVLKHVPTWSHDPVQLQEVLTMSSLQLM